MCAIPQLVSARLNPISIAEHFRRSHPQCEHSYGQHICMSEENNASNISNTRKSVSSDIQTLRSGLKKRGAAEFF